MLDEILTATPIPALRPTLTLSLSRQQLYRRNHTSEAPLKFSVARILRPYNISVAHKPITTLRRLPTNVKDNDKPEDRQGAVYKIKCCDCQATCIGKNGRKLNTRLAKDMHKRAPRNGDVNNHIAEHHSDETSNRLTLESWFTNLERTPLNCSQQLPAPFKRLIDGHKQN